MRSLHVFGLSLLLFCSLGCGCDKKEEEAVVPSPSAPQYGVGDRVSILSGSAEQVDGNPTYDATYGVIIGQPTFEPLKGWKYKVRTRDQVLWLMGHQLQIESFMRWTADPPAPFILIRPSDRPPYRRPLSPLPPPTFRPSGESTATQPPVIPSSPWVPDWTAKPSDEWSYGEA